MGCVVFVVLCLLCCVCCVVFVVFVVLCLLCCVCCVVFVVLCLLCCVCCVVFVVLCLLCCVCCVVNHAPSENTKSSSDLWMICNRRRNQCTEERSDGKHSNNQTRSSPGECKSWLSLVGKIVKEVLHFKEATDLSGIIAEANTSHRHEDTHEERPRRHERDFRVIVRPLLDT